MTLARFCAVLTVLLTPLITLADPPLPEPIDFTAETLPNGLQVIYAPMHNAPVVHVRVLYHVGSRDERPDRQGFAHMFEHMMFRGSAHVPPEEHMKLIGEVGGISNAFTDYDQTTYHDTIPSQHTQMALYLEADRMASFKVSDEIFKTERKVVSEEWRLRNANPPYGQLFQDFAKTAYTNHSYRWTPIGDMDQLRMAKSSELQEFFNKYYVPNNACLIIAGDIDPAQTKDWVHQYFGWIPKGPDIVRDIAQEPDQTATRHLTVKKFVPLPRIVMGYKTTTYTSDDHYALSLLGDILGGGRTSRLEKELVDSETPLCISADAGDQQQEDLSIFLITAAVLPGRSPAMVEKIMQDAAAQMAEKPVTAEELDRVKTQERVGIIRDRETCTQVATALGDAAVFGHDANRVNTDLTKLDAVTPEMIQAAAKKYLTPDRLTIVEYVPDPLNRAGRAAATQAAATQAAKATLLAQAPVVQSDQPIEPRVTAFPPGYPEHPPINDAHQKAVYDKGDEMTVDGIKVIVLRDARLPLVNWSLIMRRGGDSVPNGKEGLAGVTASLLRHGCGNLDYEAFSEDLDSRGITLDASDAGDTTRLTGSCTTDQFDHAMERSRQMLLQPTLLESEFEKLKQQTLGELMQSLANPGTVATRELNAAIFGDSTPQGRADSPKSIQSISLDDVNKFYQSVYHPDDAMLVFSGDITPQQGKVAAEKLIANWKPAGSLASVDYTMPQPSQSRRIVLVDNPEGKQSSIRIGTRAYDIHSDDKFPGFLAGAILSYGIDSRLNKYVRAEKGYTYGVYGLFAPMRHDGNFNVTVDTNPDTTAPCIEAVFKVLNDFIAGGVTNEELTEAQRRVAGGMVMDMQTIAQQATRRADIVLNDYPLDYFDQLPVRLGAVTTDEVRDVVRKYVKPDDMTIVVVGPAQQIKSQLEALGPVDVMPMPARRGGAAATSQPSNELMKSTPTTAPAMTPSH
jgi:zinc protease